MQSILAPEAFLPISLAAVNLGTDFFYNEMERARAVKHHSEEIDKQTELHDKEVDLAMRLHKAEMEKAHELHIREMEASKHFHFQETFLSKQTHLMSTINELEMHFAQLDADVVNASKESERDMYDQRNQQLQTLILSSSVMVAALTTLLIQGIIPDGTDSVLTVIFGATCGLSFSLLFTSVVLCIETLRLASSFMVKRAKSTGEELKSKNLQLQKIMQALRNRDDAKPTVHTTGHASVSNLNLPDFGLSSMLGEYLLPPSRAQTPGAAGRLGGNTPLASGSAAGSMAVGSNDHGADAECKDGEQARYPTPPADSLPLAFLPAQLAGRPLGRRSALAFNAIAAGSVRDPKLVDNIFENIEYKIHDFMKKRVHINQAFFAGNQNHHISFESFWERYCEQANDWAVRTFYGGTSLMLCSTILWMWAQFIIRYGSFYGGLAGIIPIGLSLPIGIYLNVFLHFRLNYFEIESQRANQLSLAREVFSDTLPKEDQSIINIAMQKGPSRTPTFGGHAVNQILGSSSYDSRDRDIEAGYISRRLGTQRRE